MRELWPAVASETARRPHATKRTSDPTRLPPGTSKGCLSAEVHPMPWQQSQQQKPPRSSASRACLVCKSSTTSLRTCWTAKKRVGLQPKVLPELGLPDLTWSASHGLNACGDCEGWPLPPSTKSQPPHGVPQVSPRAQSCPKLLPASLEDKEASGSSPQAAPPATTK